MRVLKVFGCGQNQTIAVPYGCDPFLRNYGLCDPKETVVNLAFSNVRTIHGAHVYAQAPY
ncbi:hypothetical protein SAMN05443635_109160 [Roseobacter denitrificans OCh 114]|nr:hypothetical protein SAMN05443635_109160 [Roseobacter denitrificans OCh 114]